MLACSLLQEPSNQHRIRLTRINRHSRSICGTQDEVVISTDVTVEGIAWQRCAPIVPGLCTYKSLHHTQYLVWRTRTQKKLPDGRPNLALMWDRQDGVGRTMGSLSIANECRCSCFLLPEVVHLYRIKLQVLWLV